ncbi:hypothetical protein DL98DRAFT_139216 [Cadophora sp. DSE1049]|nr:hypothetical protein DL98DRAFT_139216 [Cadophora sp. DSE1049]
MLRLSPRYYTWKFRFSLSSESIIPIGRHMTDYPNVVISFPQDRFHVWRMSLNTLLLALDNNMSIPYQYLFIPFQSDLGECQRGARININPTRNHSIKQLTLELEVCCYRLGTGRIGRAKLGDKPTRLTYCEVKYAAPAMCLVSVIFQLHLKDWSVVTAAILHSRIWQRHNPSHLSLLPKT